MKKAFKRFLQEEDGITALEYGVLAAIVVAVLVVAFKDPLAALFEAVFGKLTDAVSGT